MLDKPVDQLMAIHVATLYNIDGHGRLRSVREPWGEPRAPPRYFMGRTLKGNVWHYRHDISSRLVAMLDEICQSEPLARDLLHPPRSLSAVRDVLQALGPIEDEQRGPAYLIPRKIRDTGPEAVEITKDNADSLLDVAPLIMSHILGGIDIGPVAGIIVDGAAVCICYCARLSGLAAEAGVYTLEPMRGRGYGTSAVAGWSVTVRNRNLIPMYSTTWENKASLRVASKLDMIQYGEDWSIE